LFPYGGRYLVVVAVRYKQLRVQLPQLFRGGGQQGGIIVEYIAVEYQELAGILLLVPAECRLQLQVEPVIFRFRLPEMPIGRYREAENCLAVEMTGCNGSGNFTAGRNYYGGGYALKKFTSVYHNNKNKGYLASIIS
jgi:hypothetical protein